MDKETQEGLNNLHKSETLSHILSAASASPAEEDTEFSEDEQARSTYEKNANY